MTVPSRHCEDSVLLNRVMRGFVPVGTLVYYQSCHGTARTPSSCMLCKVSSLSGRWLIDSLVAVLRGLCPLVPCYARSRPCRDADMPMISRNAYTVLPTGGIRFWKSEKRHKIHFCKSENESKTVFANINFEYILVFANINFATKTIFPNIIAKQKFIAFWG